MPSLPASQDRPRFYSCRLLPGDQQISLHCSTTGHPPSARGHRCTDTSRQSASTCLVARTAITDIPVAAMPASVASPCRPPTSSAGAASLPLPAPTSRRRPYQPSSATSAARAGLPQPPTPPAPRQPPFAASRALRRPPLAHHLAPPTPSTPLP